MQDTLRQLLRAFLIVGLLLGAGVAVSKAVPRWKAYQVCDAERARLQGEVDALRQQITDTKRKIDRFNRSPFYVEYLARTNHRVADNEIVLIFEDEYYLFVTGSRGYWCSENFRDWTYIDAPTFPGGVVSVVERKGVLYACSMNSFNVFSCKDPKSGKWEQCGTFSSDRYGDANMFVDDDDRLYMVYGWSQLMPFRIVELDPETFKEKGELLSLLLAKMVFVKQFPNLGPYLPIEGFTKHDPEYLDFANSAVEDGDLSYPVYYFLSSLRRRLADMVIQEVERKDEPAPAIMAEAKEQPSPTPPSGVESRPTPAFDNPPPAIKAPIERIEEIPSSEGKLAIVVRKSQLSEKELKEAARYIAMTHPNLRKTQANFYVSHCEIGCYYTIADYKKHAKCAYETARTSMDKLAEEGFYKKLQLKNKYVYTPIKQN